MTYSELVRRLSELGCVLGKQGSRHEIWINPSNGQTTTIPRHHSKEVPKGTLSKIIRDLGIADQFKR